MYCKRLTYTDFNGMERTEDFRFNLTKAELIETMGDAYGRLDELLERIANSKDIPTILATFKKILLKAYGEKSEDGMHFRKSKEITEAFEQTQAFSDLYMMMFDDTDFAMELIKGSLPGDIQEEIAKLEAEGKLKLPGNNNADH